MNRPAALVVSMAFPPGSITCSAVRDGVCHSLAKNARTRRSDPPCDVATQIEVTNAPLPKSTDVCLHREIL